MRRFWITLFLGAMSFLLSHVVVYGQQMLGFTQDDRERIIRLETTLTLFMEATDKRFIELREDMNNRFEQVDQRFIELREDMNNRSKQVDKRFVELREDMNNRFEQMMNTLQLIAGIFTVLTLGVIGFAYWDRRTIIRKAKEETLETLAGEAAPKEQATIDRAVAQAVQEIKKDQRLPDLLSALRKLAANDPPLANVLKEFHLL